MNIIKNFLFKTNIEDFKSLKMIVLLIINIWLLFIFWDIIANDNIHITNNNVILVKINTLLESLLQLFGLDTLNPNTLKMIIVCVIVVFSNLAVLYFNQMIAMILLGMTARYSYKAYLNYINKDTLNYYGFEKLQELTIQEKSDILKEFLKDSNIKDPAAVEFLQNKINNINCVNKNEFMLFLNNNWLEYKQHLLSKIILHQKDQIDKIEILKNKPWWESIDWPTIIKTGGVVLLIASLAAGGYYYYNNYYIITAESSRGAEQVSNSNNISLDQTDKVSVDEFNVVKELLNNNMESITQTQTQISNVSNQVFDVIKTTKNIAVETQELADTTHNLVVKTLEINKTLNVMDDKISLNEQIISNINSQLNGNGSTIAQDSTSLVEEINLNTSTINAILAFMGIDIELNDTANAILGEIRQVARRDTLYEISNESLNNVEAVTTSSVDEQ